MRVTQSQIYRNFTADLEDLNSMLNTAGRQVASNKKLTELSDSPSGSAELVSLAEQQSNINQYRANVNSGSYYLGVTDSVLNEVHNLVTSIYTKGSQGASEIAGADARANIASEIRAMRDQLVSFANSKANGRYIFAGSAVTAAPFVQSGGSVVYQGDGDVNSIVVADGLEVRQGVAGSSAFSSIFSAVEGLLARLDSNDVSGIQAALNEFSSALSDLGQARGQVGANLSLLQNIKMSLETQETSLKSRRSNVEDANMAEAVVRLKEVQTALQTAISAGGSILPQSNLFDILG